MIDTPALLRVREVVEAACRDKNNVFGYGIWTHHIVEVVRLGEWLANKLEADVETVALAALLHDYASIKDSRLAAEHHLHGPAEAETLLRALAYPESRIAAVKECIATHRGSVASRPATVEAVCLSSADGLAHIFQVPSLFYLAFVQHGMGIDEGRDWLRGKLRRSWEKLCLEARAVARETYEAAMLVLSASSQRGEEGFEA